MHFFSPKAEKRVWWYDYDPISMILLISFYLFHFFSSPTPSYAQKRLSNCPNCHALTSHRASPFAVIESIRSSIIFIIRQTMHEFFVVEFYVYLFQLEFLRFYSIYDKSIRCCTIKNKLFNVFFWFKSILNYFFFKKFELFWWYPIKIEVILIIVH